MSNDSKRDDGGPAFPRPKWWPTDGDPDHDGVPQGGMTLRDRIAIDAMHAELVTAGMLHEPAVALAGAAVMAGRTIPDQIAHNAYLMADAMLKARR